MPRVYVNLSKMPQIGVDLEKISKQVDAIGASVARTVRSLDWEIRTHEEVKRTADAIADKTERYSQRLAAFKRFLDEATAAYSELESEELDKSKMDIPGLTTISTFEDILSFIKNVIIGKAIASIAAILLPDPKVLLTGIGATASASADWLGVEFEDDHPGVTAYLGKASASYSDDISHAGVNAYLGKASAEAEAKFNFFDGSDDDGELIQATIGASAGASLLAADAEAGIGGEALGAKTEAEGSVGTAKAEGKIDISLSEDGEVNAYAEGGAMIAAVEGKVSGTINLFGLEIGAEVGGSAGSLGVEGEAGIKDGKFVLHGGAAVGVGGEVGISIGFNPEGFVETVEGAVDAVSGAAQAVADTVSDAAQAVADTVSDVAQSVAEGVSNFWDAVTFWD